MSGPYLTPGLYPREFLAPTVASIVAVQRPSGEIPWSAGNYADPWDHVEAAMGLSIGGEWQAAELAYHWLAQQQLDDGSWWAVPLVLVLWVATQEQFLNDALRL